MFVFHICILCFHNSGDVSKTQLQCFEHPIFWDIVELCISRSCQGKTLCRFTFSWEYWKFNKLLILLLKFRFNLMTLINHQACISSFLGVFPSLVISFIAQHCYCTCFATLTHTGCVVYMESHTGINIFIVYCIVLSIAYSQTMPSSVIQNQLSVNVPSNSGAQSNVSTYWQCNLL